MLFNQQASRFFENFRNVLLSTKSKHAKSFRVLGSKYAEAESKTI